MKSTIPTPGIFDVHEAISAYRRGMTAQEVSAILGVDEQNVYKGAREQTIPSYRIGTLVRFNPSVLAKWFEEQHPG